MERGGVSKTVLSQALKTATKPYNIIDMRGSFDILTNWKVHGVDGGVLKQKPTDIFRAGTRRVTHAGTNHHWKRLHTFEN